MAKIYRVDAPFRSVVLLTEIRPGTKFHNTSHVIFIHHFHTKSLVSLFQIVLELLDLNNFLSAPDK